MTVIVKNHAAIRKAAMESLNELRPGMVNADGVMNFDEITVQKVSQQIYEVTWLWKGLPLMHERMIWNPNSGFPLSITGMSGQYTEMTI